MKHRHWMLLAGVLAVSCQDEGDTILVAPATSESFVPAVVFVADRLHNEVFELWSADPLGETIVNLSRAMVNGGDVVAFVISPDRTRVAFIADKDNDEVHELYVVPTTGGTVVRVSGPMISGGNVSGFTWAPDSSRIVYRADQETDNVHELYTSLPTGAAGNVKVSGSLVAGGSVENFFWAPDSSRIAYTADQETDGVYELYTSLPTGAAGNVKVSGTLVPDGRVYASFEWAPDSSRIAYVANQDTYTTNELYTSLPTGAAGNVKVSPTLAAGEHVDISSLSFQWAPNSSRIAYLVNRDPIGFVSELYTSLPNGAAGNVKVSGTLVAGGTVTSFRWAPDSSRIAYRADQETDNEFQLYTSLPTGAAGNVKVNGTLVAGGGAGNFHWAPDSSRIAYTAVQDTDGVVELYTSLPTGAAGNVKVNGALVAGGSVLTNFLWAPDSSRIVFLADLDTAGLLELHSAAAASPVQGFRISGLIVPADGDVTAFEVR